MIKTITIAQRKAGMTREEFNRHWLHTHGPLAARLIPYVRKYVQNHFIDVPGLEYEGDGIVEMWYDDVTSWQKSLEAIRASKELAEDAMSFATMRPGGEWVVTEHVILDKI
jgi:uncharacterized protein (TIGR02118 family)